MELILIWKRTLRLSRRVSWRVGVRKIAIGVVGYLGTSGFSRGFLNQMVETTINLQGGHIMISAKGYQDNPNIRSFLRQPSRIADKLKRIDGIQFSPLVSFQGMIASSERTSGAVINGVDPDIPWRKS